MRMAQTATVTYNVSKYSIPPALTEVSLFQRLTSLTYKIAVGVTYHYPITSENETVFQVFSLKRFNLADPPKTMLSHVCFDYFHLSKVLGAD